MFLLLLTAGDKSSLEKQVQKSTYTHSSL